MKVKEVMNKAVVVEDDFTLKQAAKVMSDKGIGSLIIMKGDKIIGIITERDVMKNVNKLSSKISSVMSGDVATIEENDTIDNAAMIMGEKKIKRLPVLHKGKLIGIITATDILANSNAMNEEFLLD
jgi:CBS domain-containing protein